MLTMHQQPTDGKLWWTMECCEASYNMHMDLRANSYCINWHTSSKQESVQTGSGTHTSLLFNGYCHGWRWIHLHSSYASMVWTGKTLTLPLLQAKLCPSRFWDLLW